MPATFKISKKLLFVKHFIASSLFSSPFLKMQIEQVIEGKKQVIEKTLCEIMWTETVKIVKHILDKILQDLNLHEILI